MSESASRELESDREFEESVIDRVEEHPDGYTLHHGGWCIGCPRVSGVDLVPKPGMTLRCYGSGIGYPVRGIVIDGVVFRYKTAAQEKTDFKAAQKKRDREKQEKYAQDRPKLEARVAALPEAIRARFDKFASANPDFWPEYGEYELFTCEEAVKIAAAFKGDGPGLEEWVRMKDYKAQAARVPALSDGHSGNTFGMACRLAYRLVTDPAMAAKEHGALVGLVGCDAYGCPHAKPPAPGSAR